MTAGRLRTLVEHAVRESPYYRDALGPDAVDARLEELPTLPKTTLMREFDRVVTDPRLRLADVEAHLASADAGAPFLGTYRVFATSGSSGVHGVVVYSEDEFATWVAAHLPVLARLGVGPATRLAAIGAPSPIHLSKQLFAALQPPGAPPSRLSVARPLDELVAALNTAQPEALIGYASVMGLLAQEQLDGRLGIEPRTVVTGAEVLTEDAEQRIGAAWGVRAFQVYATTEAPIVAASSAGADALEVPRDLVVVEVVDERNRPVQPGEPGHKVLLTNLVNRVQPLIRYELTDSVTVAPDGRIASLDGRSDDVVQLPARDGGSVALHPHRLRAPFARLADVRQYQVVVDRRLDVRVVLRPGAPADTAERVRCALLEALEDAGAAPPPIAVEPVAAIEREPGHAAKLKLIRVAPRRRGTYGRPDGAGGTRAPSTARP